MFILPTKGKFLVHQKISLFGQKSVVGDVGGVTRKSKLKTTYQAVFHFQGTHKRITTTNVRFC